MMDFMEPNEIIGLLGANAQATDLHFLLTLNSGKVRQYLLSPLHAKRLSALLSQLVGNYETQYGPIKEPSADAPGPTEKEKIGFQSP